MLQKLEEMQLKDTLRMFNGLVERCFSECVVSFRSKALTATEEKCVSTCAEKYMKHSVRHMRPAAHAPAAHHTTRTLSTPRTPSTPCTPCTTRTAHRTHPAPRALNSRVCMSCGTQGRVGQRFGEYTVAEQAAQQAAAARGE